VDLVPGAVLLPPAEGVEHNPVRRQVVRKGPPHAPVAGLVQDGVNHLPASVSGGPAARLGGGYVRLDQPPLAVGQVGRVWRPAHARSDTGRGLLDKLLDWTKLPESLAYLIDPSQTYGRLQFDDKIDAFLMRKMNDVEARELSTLRLLSERDQSAIQEWHDTYNMTEHAESRLIYFTMCLVGRDCDLGILPVRQ